MGYTLEIFNAGGQGLSAKARSSGRICGLFRDHCTFAALLDSGGCGGFILFHLLLSTLPGPFVAVLDIALPFGTQHSIPEDEEWLREVVLDTPALMVDVVVGGVVGRDLLKGVPRELVAAMVIDCFNGRHRKEPHALAGRHHGGQESHARTGCIKQESFDWMVVQSTEGVWDIKAMVARMEFDWRWLESITHDTDSCSAYHIASGSGAWRDAKSTAKYLRR